MGWWHCCLLWSYWNIGTCSTVGTVVTLGTPLEMPHGDVGGNAPLWNEARKVGEGRVVVVSQDGIGWLRFEIFWPFVGEPPFVGSQYGHMGQLVLGVAEH